MRGAIGSYVKAASEGVPAARKHVSGVFSKEFATPAGWTRMLDNMPGGSVTMLLNRSGAWWTRECFQALYVACWIHHPVEKGAYMLQLPAAGYANVKSAYERLLASGVLQSRISSHLSKRGASAHEGWDFLKGYGELLVQLEGERGGSPYLYLKCEGHALESGLSLSTIMHGASWVKKISPARAPRLPRRSTVSPSLRRTSRPGLRRTSASSTKRFWTGWVSREL